MTQSEWCAYHLFYHGDRNRALLDFVKPAVRRLLSDGIIDSFFFVRYSLGGPHLRLRLLRPPRWASQVNRVVSEAASSFLAQWPSTESITEEEIRRHNQSILTWDPLETEDHPYPDNTLLAFPFAMEIERYGGMALAGHSLDFFALSSVEALRFVEDHSEKPSQRQLPFAFVILARQGLGFAGDEQELHFLLGSAVGRWKDALKYAADRADEVFERRREALCAVLESEFKQALAASPAASGLSYVEAARRLSREIRATDRSTRMRIGKNQMHMTANRLGLSNPEETYISRLLWRAAREIAGSNPPLREDLQGFLADRAAAPAGGGRLRDLLPLAFTDFLRDEQAGVDSPIINQTRLEEPEHAGNRVLP